VCYALAGCLLFLDRDDDLATLLRQYPDEASAAWAYTTALLAFRRHGDAPETRRLLQEAEEQASAGAAPFAACSDSAAVVRYRHPPAPPPLAFTLPRSAAAAVAAPAAAACGPPQAGNHFTIRTASGATLKGDLLLDPAKKPKHMNLTHREGALRDKTWQAVYKLDGDELTICYAEADSGKDRRTEFTTAEGSGRLLTVLERQKR
jgi:uncharacterized protein (TIGR03067 family)